MLTACCARGGHFSEEQLLIVQRAGYPEEAYFTFSYSPIAGRGPDVGGVFCAVTERTTRVLAARRRITCTGWARCRWPRRPRRGSLPGRLAVVGENPADVPFTLAYLRAPDSGTVTWPARPASPASRR